MRSAPKCRISRGWMERFLGAVPPKAIHPANCRHRCHPNPMRTRPLLLIVYQVPLHLSRVYKLPCEWQEQSSHGVWVTWTSPTSSCSATTFTSLALGHAGSKCTACMKGSVPTYIRRSVPLGSSNVSLLASHGIIPHIWEQLASEDTLFGVPHLT